MHTVELLDGVLDLAQRMGYGIRHEWLGGAASGSCEIAGQKWLFVDLALNPMEQLDQVINALVSDPQLFHVEVQEPLREYFGLRRSA
ncbi:MAG: hypothetical protein P8N76_00430 [Pirellulaceae bacterium]|nr:hypothetical protein [Pirellulaceae bacterium]